MKNKIIGHVFIQADLKPLNRQILGFVFAVFSIIAVLFVVIHFLCNRLHRTIVEPLSTLTKAMELVSEDQNFSVRVLRYNDDEVGILIGGFNHMLTQIHKRDEYCVTIILAA